MINFSLDSCVESIEIIVQANEQIQESQIRLKNKLLKRNSEKDLIFKQDTDTRMAITMNKTMAMA